jgi:hypothetical protein
MIPRVSRRYWLLYPAWIVLCTILFVAFRHRDDPSRRAGRIQSEDAAVRAIMVLKNADALRFRNYEAVHVAWATRGEGGGSADRWVVLCDRVPHTELRDAVVVELDGKDGRLLKMRRVKLEE